MAGAAEDETRSHGLGEATSLQTTRQLIGRYNSGHDRLPDWRSLPDPLEESSQSGHTSSQPEMEWQSC